MCMYYVDFTHHITDRYGIVIENWSLATFLSPANIGSHVELNMLFHAWETGETQFCRLTPLELETWKCQQAWMTAIQNKNMSPAETHAGSNMPSFVEHQVTFLNNLFLLPFC
jgi:hypothetical protein